MSSELTLRELRADFARISGRSISMPLAGAIAWTVAGVLGALLPVGPASLALFFCTGMTFPLGILLSRLLHESVLERKNELARLMILNVLMVNLFWAVAIPFYMVGPSSLPLTLGIFPGLLWIPFSWIIDHRIGLFHGIARTVLVVAAWFLFPHHRFVVIPGLVVVIYLITVLVLATRRLPEPPQPKSA